MNNTVSDKECPKIRQVVQDGAPPQKKTPKKERKKKHQEIATRWTSHEFSQCNYITVN